MIGNSLGPYKILEPLGAGGMGEVYLAEDTRLGRNVAIKVLPPEFAADPERLARFEQEAKAAAALNHPHIAAVYDVGFAEGVAPTSEDGKTDPSLNVADDMLPAVGVHYIVQEYLEGDTLRVPLDKGALPIARALALGREIAAALSAAHAAGIVHRDLKPENVFVTKEGHAKVLDFGLAKLTELASPATGISMSPTVLGTVAGQVMGTAGYMAPEQVEGLETIDHRADLFAFGCLLYEMTAGKRAFGGASVLDTLHAIARTEPQPINEIKPGLPAELERILAKCLAKDPSARYQHADDLVVDLKNLTGAVESGTATMNAGPATAVAPSRGGPRVSLALVGFLVVIALAAGVFGGPFLVGSAESPMMIFDIELPTDVRMNPSAGRSAMAISPDGNTIVYSAIDDQGIQRLYRRAIDALVSVPIAGSEGAITPTFSPSGDSLVYFSGGRIHRLPLAGGDAVRLADTSRTQMPGWGDNGYIYYVDSNTSLRRIRAAGGQPELVHELEGDDIFGPRIQVLPGSRGLLVEIGPTAPRPVYALDLESKDLHAIGVAGGRPTYSPAGYVLFANDGSLWARPFDVDSLQPTGPEALVTQGLYTAGQGVARFSVSDDHKLIYGPREGAASTGESLVWLGSAGNEVDRSPPTDGAIILVRASPDPRRLMVTILRDDNSRALYLYDAVQRTFQLFTDEGQPSYPVWSPDGSYVYFSAAADGGDVDIFRRRADLSSARETVLAAESWQFVSGISPDGERLFYTQVAQGRAEGADIWSTSAEPGGEPEPLIVEAGNQFGVEPSPDGEWFAYTNAGVGDPEIWLRRVDGEGPGQKASSAQGDDPAWSPDGGEILYDWRGTQYSVRVELSSPPVIQPAEQLPFVSPPSRGANIRTFAAYDDGGETRFVMSDFNFGGGFGDGEERIIVVINWLEMLRRQTEGQ